MSQAIRAFEALTPDVSRHQCSVVREYGPGPDDQLSHFDVKGYGTQQVTLTFYFNPENIANAWENGTYGISVPANYDFPDFQVFAKFIAQHEMGHLHQFLDNPEEFMRWSKEMERFKALRPDENSPDFLNWAHAYRMMHPERMADLYAIKALGLEPVVQRPLL